MAEIKTPNQLIAEISPHYKKKGEAAEEYKIVYDSPSETLEPIYFWILDFMNKRSSDGVEKLLDNFTSTTGSGHFSELIGKGTRMQEEAMKIYGIVNTVIKSILNLIYDLKEFQIRLKSYDDANSKKKDVAQSGALSLKQIWMDQVDIKRGRGSINMLAQDLNFITLRDAFMAANSLSEAKKLDLNERVKRILEARLQEFLEWKTRSEAELRKRFEIEKTYLRTQVNTVKLYSRWAKPYLIAAEQLRMKEQDRYKPELVNIFNTVFLELALLGKSKTNVKDAADIHELPEDFKKIRFKRDYYSCVLVDFSFRGIPGKIQGTQHYAFGGRAQASFKAYALNNEEIKLLKSRLEESYFDDSLKLVEGMTEESLGQLKEDIDEFLEETPKEEIEYEKAAEQDVNPFAALVGFGVKKPKIKEENAAGGKKDSEFEKLKKEGITKDNYAESVVRKYTEKKAEDICFSIYDVYKKVHDMASTPDKV